MNINQWHEDMEIVERCDHPRGEIQLRRRGSHYEIISNGTFLMATYNGESERRLVSAALEACRSPRSVLIGGLGVGFSLQEALKAKQVERVTVLEIESQIVEWNRTVLAPVSGYSLEDERTRIIEDDLLSWLAATEERFDAICLDIDNGPDWTVYEENHRLYEHFGLHQLKNRLNPGGTLSFWSAASSVDFVERLKSVFDKVCQIPIAQQRGEPDYVYIAKTQ